MKSAVRALAVAIMLTAVVFAAAWTINSEEDAHARELVACAGSGGDFYVTWNRKPVCEHKR